jgi:hypothetical protein
MSATAIRFYVTGGTLPPGAPSYVERQADRDLYEALLRGEFCYVLHARQMGERSLIAHVSAGLREAGVAVVIADTPTTPFNIGQRIELTDFTEAEAAPLAAGLGRESDVGRALPARVLDWTGGHPYLTPRLCQVLASGGMDGTVRLWHAATWQEADPHPPGLR